MEPLERAPIVGLMRGERSLLVTHCYDHPVAVCAECHRALAFDRIGADVLTGRRDFCPTCRTDLTAALRQHLAECTLMRIQAREVRAKEPGVPAEAVEESELLRAKGQEAIDQALRVGRDYMRILTRPGPDGMMAGDEPGGASMPGSA